MSSQERFARLFEKKQGIVTTIRSLRELCERNPDAPKEEFMEIVRQAERNSGIGTGTAKLLEFGVDEYLRRRAVVVKYRDMAPNELFRMCFGKEPEGTVELLVRPTALLLAIDNSKDFCAAYHTWKIKGDMSKITDEMIADLGCVAGGAIYALPLCRELDYSVMIFRGMYHKNPAFVIHEEQHHFNRIFSPPEPYIPLPIFLSGALSGSQDIGELRIRKTIRGVARFLKQNVGLVGCMRDELLAMFRDGRSLSDIQRLLAGSYLDDYLTSDGYCERTFDELVWDAPGKYKEHLALLVSSGQEAPLASFVSPIKFTPERVRQEMENVFRDETCKDIARWTHALEMLEEKGYTREEIIDLLYIEPIARWQKVERRMPAKSFMQRFKQTVARKFAAHSA